MLLRKKKIKRTVALMSVFLMLSLLVVPAAAASYDDGSFRYHETYHALIPYSDVTFSSESSSWSGSAEGSSLVITTDEHGLMVDPSACPVFTQLFGYDYFSGSEPVPDILEYTYKQSWYENPTELNSARNEYVFSSADLPNHISFTASSFAVNYLDFGKLTDHCYLELPAANQVQYSVSVVYWRLKNDHTGWELKHGFYSGSLLISPDESYEFYPRVLDLFELGDRSLYPDGLIPIESFTLSFDFHDPVAGMSLGMQYGEEYSFAQAMSDSFDYIREYFPVVEVVENKVYITESGGDFFAWLIDGADAFFNTPIFGEISLGSILAFVVSLGLAGAFIKLFG